MIFSHKTQKTEIIIEEDIILSEPVCQQNIAGKLESN